MPLLRVMYRKTTPNQHSTASVHVDDRVDTYKDTTGDFDHHEPVETSDERNHTGLVKKRPENRPGCIDTMLVAWEPQDRATDCGRCKIIPTGPFQIMEDAKMTGKEASDPGPQVTCTALRNAQTSAQSSNDRIRPLATSRGQPPRFKSTPLFTPIPIFYTGTRTRQRPDRLSCMMTASRTCNKPPIMPQLV